MIITDEELMVACDWLNSNGKEYKSDRVAIISLSYTSVSQDKLMSKSLPHYLSNDFIFFQTDLIKDFLGFFGVYYNDSKCGNKIDNSLVRIDPRMLV